jgi:hypothetical protein
VGSGVEPPTPRREAATLGGDDVDKVCRGGRGGGPMKVRRAEFGSVGLEWSAAHFAEEEREWQMGIWEGRALLGCVSVLLSHSKRQPSTDDGIVQTGGAGRLLETHEGLGRAHPGGTRTTELLLC